MTRLTLLIALLATTTAHGATARTSPCTNYLSPDHWLVRQAYQNHPSGTLILKLAPGLFDPRDRRRINRRYLSNPTMADIFDDLRFGPNHVSDHMRFDLNSVVPPATWGRSSLNEHEVIPELVLVDQLRSVSLQRRAARFLRAPRLSRTPRLLLLNDYAPARDPGFIRANTLMLESLEGEINVAHPRRTYEEHYGRFFERQGETLPMFAAERVLLIGESADFAVSTHLLILSALQHGLKRVEFIVITDLVRHHWQHSDESLAGRQVASLRAADPDAAPWIVTLTEDRNEGFEARRVDAPGDPSFVVSREGRSLAVQIRLSSTRAPEWR